LQIFTPYLNLSEVFHHAKGDKVRIKAGPFATRKGTLLRLEAGKLVVTLTDSAETIIIDTKNVTNFSLAARRAWRSMPHRKVGRPVGTRVSDRVSVIFRIDRALWKDFMDAEEAGLIQDRTTAINNSLRAILEMIQRPRARAS
jgi:KOW motif-containing protein